MMYSFATTSIYSGEYSINLLIISLRLNIFTNRFTKTLCLFF